MDEVSVLQPMLNHDLGSMNIELASNFGKSFFKGTTPLKTPKIRSDISLKDSLNIKKAHITTINYTKGRQSERRESLRIEEKSAPKNLNKTVTHMNQIS